MSGSLPVHTATLLDPQEAFGFVRAALDGAVVLVPLDRAPRAAGQHVVELRAPGLRTPILVVAEPVGEPTAGMFPMRLRPKDGAHAAHLAALIDAPPPSDPTEPGKRRERASFRVMDLPLVGGARPTQTLDSLDAPLADVIELGALSTLDTPNERAEFLTPERPLAKPASDHDDLTGTTLASGRYEIVEAIGRGGSGKVYRARHTGLGSQVAVKVLHRGRDADARAIRRFEREARTMSKLDHPNVTRVVDFGQEPSGRLFIAMELLEGTGLHHLIAERAPFPLRSIVNLMTQICGALSAAHDQGIIHRDMKPENVIVVPRTDDDGQTVLVVKVCDFGTARILEPDAPTDSTGTGFLCGTPEFMAPEQVLSEPADAATDMYSCGVMLFEMATGRLPFRAPSVVAVLNSQLYDPPPKISRVVPDADARLEKIVAKALQKDRRRRHQSARELRDDLLALIAS